MADAFGAVAQELFVINRPHTAHARERSARGVPTPSRGTVPRRCGVGQARKRACQCACRTLGDTLRVLAQIGSCRPRDACRLLYILERGFCLLKGIAEGTYNSKHAEAAKLYYTTI